MFLSRSPWITCKTCSEIGDTPLETNRLQRLLVILAKTAREIISFILQVIRPTEFGRIGTVPMLTVAFLCGGGCGRLDIQVRKINVKVPDKDRCFWVGHIEWRRRTGVNR